jgi:hypothetical protein
MGFNYTDEYEDGFEDGSSSLEEAADEVVDDTMYTEHVTHDEERVVQETIRERAIKQMEHANLYRVLLEGNIFAPNSARAEIQSKVESEIKLFIEERLIELLNIGQVRKPEVQTQFDEKEVSALKILANKLAEKMPDSAPKKQKEEQRLPTPTLNSIAVSTPVNATPSLNTVSVPQKTVSKPVTQAKAPRSAPAAATKSASKKQKKNYNQVNNPNKTRMPSLAEQEALYLNQMAALKGNPILDQVLVTSKGE